MGKHLGTSRSTAVLALLAFMVYLPARQAHAESFDAGVENEAVMANSEGAIAEAEEAQKREAAEKDRNEQAQKLASHEADHAKKVEADAKVTLAKAMNEEARLKKERQAAEIRKQAATDKIKETQVELQARQTQIDVLRELTNKTVADRDALEQTVKMNNDKLAMLDSQILVEKKRKTDSDAAFLKSKEKLAKSKTNVREASARLTNLQNGRSPSSVATGNPTGAGPATAVSVVSKEGWVHLKKDCGMTAIADSTAAQTQSVKAGDRLFARKYDSNWIEVRDRTAGSTTGYLPIGCVK